MDLNDTPEQASYRERGAGLARGTTRLTRRRAAGSSEDKEYIDSRRAWQRKLAEAGLAGVTWPKEYGGQGRGPIEQVTVNQEIWRRPEVPGILDVIGLGMLGPCLIAHGIRGAEEPLPRPDAPRRRGLVPAVLGARRGLRPGGGADARAAGTRTAAGR